VTFCGNVTLGQDIGLSELRSLFHAVGGNPLLPLSILRKITALREGQSHLLDSLDPLLTASTVQVVLSYGAESDRRLGIPGEVSGVLQSGLLGMRPRPGTLQDMFNSRCFSHPVGSSFRRAQCQGVCVVVQWAPRRCLSPCGPEQSQERSHLWHRWAAACSLMRWLARLAPLPVIYLCTLRSCSGMGCCSTRAEVKISGTICAVTRAGNVALDCARVLLQPPARLMPTDIAKHALQALMPATQQGGQQLLSSVERVHLVARRGPAQAGNNASPCVTARRQCAGQNK
jgi:hypothetical protein